MPDNLPNPAAADVVSTPIPPPQTQSDPLSGQQVAPQQTQQFNSPAQPVGASGMGGPSPQQAAQAATIARAAKTGLGFHALMGNHVEYQQTPNGPVPVPTQNKPGQLFRSILAGAIMGGAAGGSNEQNNAGSGWAAAARGAGAARQGAQQQQQQAGQQAQQQWQNSLEAQKANRDQQGFDTEQQVRKAQIAQANAETLRTNIITQGDSLKVHQQVADADKDRISTFANAGVKPTFEDIPESQMQDIIKNSPGASALDWRHTGVKMGVDANGQPTYEYTLSAYDPKASAPLSDATVKQWKEDGLFKYHPEYVDVAKPGKTLTVGQFTALDKQAQNYSNQTLAKTSSDLTNKKIQSEIDKDNAQRIEALTTSSKINQEIKDEALGKTQAAQFDVALKELNTKNGNFDALEPSSRIVIAESMNKMVPGLTKLYQDQVNDSTNPNSQQEAGETLKQIQNLTSLSTRALSSVGITPKTKPADVDTVSRALGAVSNLTPDAAQDAIKNSTTLTPEQKTTALEQWHKNRTLEAQQTRNVIGGVIKGSVINALP